MRMNFDATQVDPTNQFDVIPAGEYEVMITESERKFTKSGDGAYLQLTLEIQSGEFQGRKLFDRLNLENSNRTAVDIAQRQLSQICHAVGVMQVSDSEQLHYKPMIAKVKVRPPRGEYDASNEIGGYLALNGAKPQPKHTAAAFHSTPHATPQRTAQPQKPAATPPWAAQG